MKIYTKTGDSGTTGLIGGERISKSDPRLETYGTLDELNACLGMAQSCLSVDSVKPILNSIQEHLFVLGSEMACIKKIPSLPTLDPKAIVLLERSIDEMEKELPPLRNFILPGGDSCGATLHFARTICRRAERNLISLIEKEPSAKNPIAIQYLNRLSDYLFVAARFCNFKARVPETTWSA